MKRGMKWAPVAALALLGAAQQASAAVACPQTKRLKMRDLPASVSTSIQAEANGAKVKELGCAAQPDGTIRYQAEVVRKDKAVDLELDQVGIVLSRRTHSDMEEHINKP